MAQTAVEQTRALVDATNKTAAGWQRLRQSLAGPRVDDVEAKLADVTKRAEAERDPITAAHLLRAAHALAAQKSAIDGLRVAKGRAEAAVEAKLALLARLRLAIAQFSLSERERFTLELNAVADQVSALTDDLDALTLALREAESFVDQRVLADVERRGREALRALEESASHHQSQGVEAPTTSSERAEIGVTAKAGR